MRPSRLKAIPSNLNGVFGESTEFLATIRSGADYHQASYTGVIIKDILRHFYISIKKHPMLAMASIPRGELRFKE